MVADTWQTKRADVFYLFFPNKTKNIFTLDFTALTISWKFHYIEDILSFFSWPYVLLPFDLSISGIQC